MICFLSFILPVQAFVLDWSGSYEVELNTLQKADFEEWGSSEMFHNLHLKPEIKAFDGVRVQSWFQFSPQVQAVPSVPGRNFYNQEGLSFGLQKEALAELPLLAVRDLYLQIDHAFGRFEIGWKPYQFGLGMFYNNSHKVFSPYYNLESTRGFVSWKGVLGSYYVQPQIHYLSETSFNLLLQGGWNKDKYGVELLYKLEKDIVETESTDSTYFGAYAFYIVEKLSVQMEIGINPQDAYGGVLEVKWQAPLNWLGLNLDVGVATVEGDEGDAKFYFDPSFAAQLSFLVEEYANIKPSTSSSSITTENATKYTLHSVAYVSPSASFSILDSLTLDVNFSTHLSYVDWSALLYSTELILKYELAEGVMWNTGIGALFPSKDHWYIGAISQAAITF